MADEYIRREDAVHTIMGQPPDAHYPSWYAAQIEDIPAADVVPVVRCRDCREFAKTSHWCESFDNPTGEDDFCSYGKRREE